VGFFERNRASLAKKGYDPERLPPGQYFTERFPVLHVGDVPNIGREQWTLHIFGEVAQERTLTFDELRALQNVYVVVDIHCVTKWSKFDTRWHGVRFRDVMALVDVSRRARRVRLHDERAAPRVAERRRVAHLGVRRRTVGAGTRWSGPAAAAEPLLLEVGEVVARHRVRDR
jgi:DMSO/TMAO reductase YedYZ molybdopterin-dependent catalytic subunit